MTAKINAQALEAALRHTGTAKAGQTGELKHRAFPSR